VRLVAALAVGLALGVAAAPARAYVPFRNGDARLYWKKSCVPVTIYTNGFEEVMPLDQIAKSIAAAAHAWSSDAVSCSADGTTHPSLEIVPTIVPGRGMATVVPNDARNTIVFLRDAWGINGSYATNGLAFTRDTASPDGHILDADIEINAVPADVQWANLDPGVVIPPGHSDVDLTDLQNTMTHEFGHFIGLAHSCYRPGKDPAFDVDGNPRPLDDQGKPALACDDPAASIVQDSVMYDQVDYRQISKRALKAEDIRAVCDIYKPTLTPDPCALDEPLTGCAVAPRDRGRVPSVAALAAISALGLFVARRRRRSFSGSGRARA
jgi:MYXO-CTERM domain-containing protein